MLKFTQKSCRTKLIMTIGIFSFILGLFLIVNYKVQRELELELISMQNQLEREEATLNSMYINIDNELNQGRKSLNSANKMADSSLKAKVCSKANYYYNNAKLEYENFEASITYLKGSMPEYKIRYERCSELSEKINNIQKKLSLDEEYFSKVSAVPYLAIEKEENELLLLSKKSNVIKKVKASKDYADKLYNEYYDLMVTIVTGEAGDKYYPDLDQFCVMNVIENRIESKYFPNTIKQVIFQPGQYQPTWDGSWSKQPNQRTKNNVDAYLRGKVDTDMPENVLFQAMFKQGDYVWKHITNKVDGGHYYCAIEK